MPADVFQRRVLGLAGFGILSLAAVLFLPPWPQDPGYHRFADDRTLFGVPNALNVLSNVPFVLVGLAGCVWLLRQAPRPDGPLREPGERGPWLVMFLGVLLTGFGSGYYHLDPEDARLVWDRLPMTVAFMSFFAATLGERIQVRVGVWLLGPLLLLGVGSVVNWRQTDDLRLYGVVQFFPMLAIPLLLLLMPPRYTGSGYVWGAIGWYAAAKVLETHAADHGLFALGHLVSGHTLKHLAAAGGAFWLLLMLWRRRPLESGLSPDEATRTG
jgi:hypothetical protein